MNTGHNPMLPLDDFVVKMVHHGKLPTMLFDDWFDREGWPPYSLRANMHHPGIIFMHILRKKPTDVEVIFPPEAHYYRIVWLD